jgi:hypothetical protein
MAKGFKQLNEVNCVTIEDSQEFLQKQFGNNITSIMFIDDDMLFIGTAAEERLIQLIVEQRVEGVLGEKTKDKLFGGNKVPSLLTDTIKSQTGLATTVLSELAKFEHNSDINGQLSISDDAKPELQELSSWTEVKIE